jgi:hypothetical protein
VFCQLFSNSLGLAFVGFISAILPTLLLACFNNFLPLLPAAIVISHFLLPAYFLNFLPLLPAFIAIFHFLLPAYFLNFLTLLPAFIPNFQL